MPSTTPLEIAYLAGLIDGEGCIYLDRYATRKYYGYRLAIRVTNEHHGALLKYKEIYGGSLYELKGKHLGQRREI